MLDPVANAIHDEIRLVALVERGIQLDALAVGAAGPQILAEAPGVVRDERVGGFQYGAGRAVVLLELDELRLRIVAAELVQILDARAAPAVDGVVRNNAARDEIVGALDIEVVDFGIMRLALDALDDVEPT